MLVTGGTQPTVLCLSLVGHNLLYYACHWWDTTYCTVLVTGGTQPTVLCLSLVGHNLLYCACHWWDTTYCTVLVTGGTQPTVLCLSLVGHNLLYYACHWCVHVRGILDYHSMPSFSFLYVRTLYCRTFVTTYIRYASLKSSRIVT